jgi:hypothetical protein
MGLVLNGPCHVGPCTVWALFCMGLFLCSLSCLGLVLYGLCPVGPCTVWAFSCMFLVLFGRVLCGPCPLFCVLFCSVASGSDRRNSLMRCCLPIRCCQWNPTTVIYWPVWFSTENTKGSGSFSEVKRPGRGVAQPPRLAPRLKSRAIPLQPLRSFVACYRVIFTFTLTENKIDTNHRCSKILPVTLVATKFRIRSLAFRAYSM